MPGIERRLEETIPQLKIDGATDSSIRLMHRRSRTYDPSRKNGSWKWGVARGERISPLSRSCIARLACVASGCQMRSRPCHTQRALYLILLKYSETRSDY